MRPNGTARAKRDELAGRQADSQPSRSIRFKTPPSTTTAFTHAHTHTMLGILCLLETYAHEFSALCFTCRYCIAIVILYVQCCSTTIHSSILHVHRMLSRFLQHTHTHNLFSAAFQPMHIKSTVIVLESQTFKHIGDIRFRPKSFTYNGPPSSPDRIPQIV